MIDFLEISENKNNSQHKDAVNMCRGIVFPQKTLYVVILQTVNSFRVPCGTETAVLVPL